MNIVVIKYVTETHFVTISRDKRCMGINIITAQKMEFSIKDFFSKCDQIRSFLQIWSHY